jgi:hypothetical protein
LERINVSGDNDVQVRIGNRAGIGNGEFTNGTMVFLPMKVFVGSYTVLVIKVIKGVKLFFNNGKEEQQQQEKRTVFF